MNDAPFVENDSEKLFIPKPGWKIKYTKIIQKKTKWHIKNKDVFVYLWEDCMKNCCKKLGEKALTTNKSFSEEIII